MLADTHVHPYYGRCPQEIIESLQRYALQGIPVGGFLQAVLENNLKEAVMRAHPLNGHAIPAIVSYIYNEMPRDSQGSPAAYESWVSQGGIEGLKKLHAYAHGDEDGGE